ncbi:hypothetical protein CEXT_352051 [Caerostris extrusa]|uniref:Uncharacterized protein n=1 Tax=Caerostris extrusa TaxID=172846 RepID=A0AAV4WKT4_CAEEX|nr:hypothetical protein CEXT_352051 [Caerostris extrusa]
MYNLDRLHLSYNPFARVTENSFNGKTNITSYILLDHCLIREFSVRQYIELPLLVTLDLNYNLIDQVTYQLGHNQKKKNFTDDHVREIYKRPHKALVNGRQSDPVPEIQRLHRVERTPVFATAGQPHRARGAQHLQVPSLCPGGPGLERERDPVPGGLRPVPVRAHHAQSREQQDRGDGCYSNF